MIPQERIPVCDIGSVGHRQWDAIVIGAGPAGSLAAHQLARSGYSVLLVDKAKFPRRKVCGCYLNGSALATLDQVGLGSIPVELHAPAITGVHLGANRKTVALRLPAGAAISREALDTELIRRACGRGVEFLCETAATLSDVAGNTRTVELTCGKHRASVACKVVLVADGIAGQSLRHNTEIQFAVSRTSWVGASCVSDIRPPGFERGQIYMAINTAGYVGAVMIEDDRIDIAAAFNPRKLKLEGPDRLAHSIVAGSGLPLFTGQPSSRWLGTPPLTRTPNSRAGQRFFLIGDAAGYVEPFTGEGMSWALASARAVTPLAIKAISDYSPDLIEQWNRRHYRMLGAKRRLCRFVTRRLRGPTLPGLAISTLAHFPALANPVLRWWNQAPHLPILE